MFIIITEKRKYSHTITIEKGLHKIRHKMTPTTTTMIIKMMMISIMMMMVLMTLVFIIVIIITEKKKKCSHTIAKEKGW